MSLSPLTRLCAAASVAPVYRHTYSLRREQRAGSGEQMRTDESKRAEERRGEKRREEERRDDNVGRQLSPCLLRLQCLYAFSSLASLFELVRSQASRASHSMIVRFNRSHAFCRAWGVGLMALALGEGAFSKET